MNKEFIPAYQALELKFLGFNEDCFGYYHNVLGSDNINLFIEATSKELYTRITIPEYENTLAPLYQQAFRWFREKYNLDSYILCTYIGVTSQKNNEYSFAIQHCDDYDYFVDADRYTYEEAELACLKKLIEIVRNK